MPMTGCLAVTTDLVKEAFNAMMQSSTPLLKEPEDIDLSEVDFDWPFLRQAILDAHKPIQDMFFKGHGNYLQYVECYGRGGYAEVCEVWLSSCASNMIVLLCSTHSESQMSLRRICGELLWSLQKDIKIGDKMGIFNSPFDEQECSEPSFGEQFPSQREYSQWENRNN